MRILFFVVVFLICFGISLWTTINFAVKKDVVNTPDLIGIDSEYAEKLVISMGLKYFEKEQKFDLKAEKGVVIAQNPPAGLKMKRGHTVEVSVSKGLEQLIVPNLTGHSLKKAQILLEHAKFSSGKLYKVYSERVKENVVIAQEPPAMEKRSPETKISLVVSRGEPVKYYVMPELVGLSSDMAKLVLTRIGIDDFNIRYAESDILSDSVLSQVPVAGGRIRVGDIVVLTLAKE